MNEIQQQIVKAYTDGNFLPFVYEQQKNGNAFIDDLIFLHNTGEINVVQSFSELRNIADFGYKFFSQREIFSKILPGINADTQDVMDCLNNLVNEAKGDAAATWILSSLDGFFSSDEKRSSDMLNIAASEPEKYYLFISRAITANPNHDEKKYFDKIIPLLSHKNKVVRSAAIFSLGKIKYGKESILRKKALERLAEVAASEIDDQVLGNIVGSVYNFIISDSSLLKKGIEMLIEITSKGGEFTTHIVSEEFALNADSLSDEIFNVFTDKLVTVNIKNKGTFNRIGMGLRKLLKANDYDKVITFLERFLLIQDEAFSFRSLDGFPQTFCADTKFLNKILTKWFLSGEVAFCKAASVIIDETHNEKLTLEIDTEECSDVDRRHLVFLARKSVGYLFSHPITATSLIVSLMRLTDDDVTLKDLADLLFYPLLISYSGNVREYLEDRLSKEIKLVKDYIQKALDRLSNYLKIINSVGNLPELQPYQRQKEAYAFYSNKILYKQYKEAEKKSPFLNTAKKITLLYGAKCVSYINRSSALPQRVEIPLQQHSFSVEMPRLVSIDSVGLDLLLRRFRLEKLLLS